MNEVTTSLDNSFKNDLIDVFRNAYKPSDARLIYEWAKDNVSLYSGYTIKGPFDVSISPHFKKIFDAYQDPFVREVNILAPPRSGKTLIAEICFLHDLISAAIDILWLQVTEEKAGQVTDLRMIPLLKSCKPVADLIDTNSKYAVTEGRFKFLHSTVIVTSPKENTFNSLGYGRIFWDEVEKVKGSSIIKNAKRRMDDYKGVSKCMFFSQGGIKDSPWYEQFYSGEVYEYGWTCPKCNKLQRFEFQGKRTDGSRYGIVWPNNNSTKDANNRWLMKECSKQSVLECKECKYQVTDNPQNREHILHNGEWIKVCGDNSTVKSFRFTNLCNVKIPFAELTTRFLGATQKKDYFGDTDDLEDFIKSDLADFWDGFVKRQRTEIKLSSYDISKPFGETEAFRFMGVDCQATEPFFYYVVRACNRMGESRLIAQGTCNTLNELDAIRDRHKIDYRFVLVDSGNGTKTETIYAECVKHGRWAEIDGETIWTSYISLKGSGAKGFRHDDNKWYRYAEPKEYPVALADGEEDEGKILTHVTFSSFRYSQILETLRDGKGKKWEAVDVTQEYTDHLNAVVLQRKLKGNTADFEYVDKPNTPAHFWDCEKEILVGMDLYGCLDAGEVKEEEENITNTETIN